MLEKTKRLKDTENYTHLERFWKFIENWNGENSLEQQFLPRWQDATRLVEEPLSIAVMGEFNAGKSSFINALLGKEKFLPVSVIPKTATISILKYGDAESVEIFYNDNSREKISGYDYLGKINKASKIIDEGHELYVKELSRIQKIEITCDSDYLKHFKIIDTPGFNHESLMDEKANSVLDQIDLVIWLFQGRQAGSTTEIERIKEIRELGKPVYIILNKIDSVEDSERDDILQHLFTISKHLCCNENGQIFGVCSNAENIKSDKKYEYLFKDLQNELEKVFFNNDYEISHSHLGKLRKDLENHIDKEINENKTLIQEITILSQKVQTEHEKYLNQKGQIIEAVDAQAEKLLTSFALILAENALENLHEEKTISKDPCLQSAYSCEYLNLLRGHDALRKAMLGHSQYLFDIFSESSTSMTINFLTHLNTGNSDESHSNDSTLKKLQESIESFSKSTESYCHNFMKSEIYGFLAGTIDSDIFTKTLQLAQELPQQKNGFFSLFGKKTEEIPRNTLLTRKVYELLNTLTYININRDYFDYDQQFSQIEKHIDHIQKTLSSNQEALAQSLNLVR